MKTEWMVADVIVVRFPDREKRAISRVISARRFLPIQAVFLVREPLSNVGNPTCDLISLLRVIQ